MKKYIIFSLLYLKAIYGASSFEDYFSYLEQISQPKGDYKKGEIEIVNEPAMIEQIQKKQENRLLGKGFSAEEAVEFSRVGVVNEDQYWIWLRDAVYFPGGALGTYDRLIWRGQLDRKSPGVAVLPLLPSGKVVLILTYRHATRSWELELPRGGVNLHETLQQAAVRELKEETGFFASSVNRLGEMATDTGALSSVIPVFLAKISAKEDASPEYSEAIAKTFAFTKKELKKGLVEGFLEVDMQKQKKQVPLRDAFLTFALLQAEYRNLL